MADGQIRAGFNVGVTSAGAYSGGLTLMPSLTYAVRFTPVVEASLTNVPMITGLGYHNLGVVDHTMLGVAGHWAWGYIGGAVSADVFDTILCGRICNRVAGVTPGADVGAAYYSWFGDHLGLRLSGHLSWVVSGAVYSGPIWTISIGPTVRVGGVKGGL